MPRTLLISREDGRVLKTYGVKRVRTIMKFSFIISVVAVFLRCGTTQADTRILNDLKYLEYLNDLDRRNVELDDIHKQWPFHSISRNPGDELHQAQKAVDREKLLQVVSLAKEMANKHTQDYRDRILEELEDRYKQMKETSDRADQLSQYRRYKPYEETLEEVRMYPERNDDEVRLTDEDDNDFQNSEVIMNEEDEPITQFRPVISGAFFPRIAPVDKPINYENTFQVSHEEEDEEPAEEEEKEEIPNRRPIFPKAYFPRIAPVDIPVNYQIDGLNFPEPKIFPEHSSISSNHHDTHHEHEEYTFKTGEEFPQTISFNQVPVAEDPSEFGVGPTDPRFYRDAEKTEDEVTMTPKQPDPVYPYIVKSPHVSKPKMNSRSDLQNQFKSLPNTEEGHLFGSFMNKDVSVVPFKPDTQSDTTGVYIIAIVAGISAAATVGLIAVGIGWYNLQKHMKNAEDADYPSYGIVGPNKDYEKKGRDEAGDRRLAQSAQMYHYQHQKQQIIAMGRNPQGHGSQSDSEEEEDEEGNYTVYECPGLASIEGPLEVKNPMFDDNQLATPSQTPSKVTEDTK